MSRSTRSRSPFADPASGSAAGRDARSGLAGMIRRVRGSGQQTSHVMPVTVGQQFLRIRRQYFFADRTLAFIDDGNRIRVRTDNSAVVQSVVAIAQARGWRVIAVRGSETFRQAMWQEAVLRGIEAQGYEPSALEALRIRRAMEREPAHAARPDPAAPEANLRPPEDIGPRQHQHRQLNADASRLSPGASVRAPQVDAERQRTGLGLLAQGGDSAARRREPARRTRETHDDSPVLTGPVGRHAHSAHAGRDRPPEGPRTHAANNQPTDLSLARERAPARSIYLEAGLRLAQQYARHVTRDASSRERLLQDIHQRIATALQEGRQLRSPERRRSAVPTRHKGRNDPPQLTHEHL